MNLYQRILAATKDLHGWADEAKQLTLANLVLAIDARLIVEIGVWGGKSLIPMAMAAQSKGPCQVLAIDPWKAHESVMGQTDADAEWWNDQGKHDVVFNSFMRAREKLGLQNVITVLRQSSNETIPPDEIDILHEDANHGPQCLINVSRFAPKVRVGGFCILDDLEWTGGHVKESAEWLKKRGFLELFKLGTGAAFIRL